MKLKKSVIIVGIVMIFVFISGLGFFLIQNKKENAPVVLESSEEKEQEEIGYDYSKPVLECSPMENETYFNDAIFIGDSRTEGFMGMTNLDATFFTHIGLTVDTFFSDPVIYMNGQKVSILEALKNTNFQKVYIMLGINETGWKYSNLFAQKYGEIIDAILQINPEAIIYIESILPVSKEVSDTHAYIKQDKINEYNSLLQNLAMEKKVYYLDIASFLKNEEGYLPVGASLDGIHLNKEYSLKWLQYLKNHYIVENALEGEIE